MEQTLMNETINILNELDYKLKEASPGIVNPYYIKENMYFEKTLQKDQNGDKFMYILLHGSYPVKYILLSEDCNEYLNYVKENEDYLKTKELVEECDDDKYGVFKVIWMSTFCKLVFNDIIEFPSLPNGFDTRVNNGNLIVEKKIKCDIEESDCDVPNCQTGNTYCYDGYKIIRRNAKDIKEEIINANKELLKWAKSLQKI